ncbi:winged helix DNA-binding domain-containing protein [Corynebacterium sanguinis]|uniref:Winged helix DNA-binding domain-containing protein n=1 Tax=Corynebacterium sanguinis TaxID=2594913 RepID=A0A838WUI8_9CORY|nr:winged helix DNA-binding domain-containing protein [Corynebacterium sanguinis]MBA4505549.1 winged helix DNA-binding domain-containing protein [Corynebacterium sanguinis]MCT1412945.1 winged helix DNA-binding domain-containing protein [Corynebacterium sanguinis]MCT1414835.1 winged helix DNA-binding domain-containing protein [Corynebacterium sanguinis]MCT1445536.1 winged helix DNA-binding domain-containing protein [Corynebacterium sanguinis]MCT1464553.1 winged helix DNA-binding domain-containi
MKQRTRARARLLSQRLVGHGWPSAVDAVRAFGLMQGQETTVFSSIALRNAGGIDSVAAALDGHEIVRAYPMRGTVFVALAADMRWLTELLAKPGVAGALRNADAAGVSPARIDAIRDAVLEHGPVDNAQYKAIVARVLDSPEPVNAMVYRSRYVLLVDGSCAYLGRNQLLGPAPAAPGIAERFNGQRQDAVDELVRRYVATHGPVTSEDVTWWSKLGVREVRTALEHLGDDFTRDGEDYFHASLPEVLEATPASAFREPHLLPAFDEYILGYKDRLFAMTDEVHTHLAPRNMGIFRKSIVVDGVVRGTWKGAGGTLVIDDVGGVPKYAHAGVRRKFAAYPALGAVEM